MSRTDAGTSSPPMSCQSEPYGGGRDDLNGNNFDTVSTKSLPNNPSVSAKEKKKEEDAKVEEAFDPWEALMLRDDPRKNVESIATSEDQRDSGNWLFALEETATQVQDTNPMAIVPSGNWLLALEETATQVQDTNSMAIVPFGLNDPVPALQATTDQYNPFLEDTATAPLAAESDFQPLAGELMTTFNALAVTEFQPQPTFQVNFPEDFEPSSTPTFKAIGSLPEKCDPFATFESFGFGETVSENGGVNQQSVLQEQQLWLQNQNKIMAKHLI